MIDLQTWDAGDKAVRTQITLTQKLKALVEKIASEKGESLSEYLRKAALVRALVEEKDKEDMESIAMRVVGSVNPQKHPEWKNEKDVNKWVIKIRREW